MKRSTIFATLERLNLRDEQLEGEHYLVAPVVMLVEGVHTGTGGALYYSPAEIAAHFETWNGVPLVISHPSDANGNPLSANTPAIRENQSIGTLFNVHFDSNGSKLKGEVWINILKAEKVSQGLVASIRSNSQVEISTGMFMDEDSEAGNWRGEDYIGNAKDFRPDHLAILIGQQGACSWGDGCGIRANKETDSEATRNKEDEPMKKKDTSTDVAALRDPLKDKLILFGDVKDEDKPGILQRVKNLLGAVVYLHDTKDTDKTTKLAQLMTNELGHNDLHSKLQTLVDQLDNESWLHWIREVFDNNFIYEARSTNPSEGMGGSKLYKRDYTVSAETEEVTIADEVEEVREETNYVSVAQATGAVQTNTTVKEDTVKTKAEKVKALIACERTRFTEKNEDWLNTLDDCTLATLEAVEVKEPEKEPEKVVDNVKTPPKADPPKDEKPVTLEDYVAKAPPEIQAVLNRSVARDAAVKETLVKGILANKRNKFSEERLNTMSIDDLEGLAELANVEVDYTGQAPGVNTEVDDGSIPPAPSIWNLDDTDKEPEKKTG